MTDKIFVEHIECRFMQRKSNYGQLEDIFTTVVRYSNGDLISYKFKTWEAAFEWALQKAREANGDNQTGRRSE